MPVNAPLAAFASIEVLLGFELCRRASREIANGLLAAIVLLSIGLGATPIPCFRAGRAGAAADASR